MNRATRIKVTIITIISVIVGFVYIYRGQLINNFKMAQLDREWSMDESQGQFLDGQKNGEWKTYFQNGRLAKIENYVNDTLNGSSIRYRPTGKFHARCNYKMGVLVDSSFSYHPNGRLSLVEFYDNNGKQQGVFKIYHDNGQLSHVGQKLNGRLDGESKSFYKSGRLKEISYYKNLQRTGKWIWLSETGDTTKIESY